MLDKDVGKHVIALNTPLFKIILQSMIFKKEQDKNKMTDKNCMYVGRENWN